MLSRSILVVDDNDLILEMIGAALSYLGHQVAFATNGAQAIAAFSVEEFDLVITDIDMPIRDGFEVIRELKKRSSRSRIIAISGENCGSQVGYLDYAKELGAHAALAKPFTIPELERTMSAVFEGLDRDNQRKAV